MDYKEILHNEEVKALLKKGIEKEDHSDNSAINRHRNNSC